ncbi:cell division protein FtsA [Candidatus Berkelbacteria bacterium]|nr:cell division protein FtsA [Candidatus Berkelbacteria bacterium]MBI2588448.1 cell division protein FtsA [Candidatus Berkelbacteria bacterium]MBI4029571.1 cell division protein FtsA [Candidatus Berkelbacteria bacterium]
MEGNFVLGLDVGSSKTALVAGMVNEGLVEVAGAGFSPNTGMRKGMVATLEDVVSSIGGALEEAEQEAKTSFFETILGLAGSHITATPSRGIIGVARADNEITETDVEKVLGAARAVALPPNQEILHIEPQYFAVDGQNPIKDPIGLAGVRLETEALVIGASSMAIRNLTKTVAQAGLSVMDLVYPPLPLAHLLLSKKQKETGVSLVDIGAGTTTLAIFEEGNLIHTAVYPIGSLNLTNDLAIGLKTSLEVAEQVKQKDARVNIDLIKESEQIDLFKYSPQNKERVKKKFIANILEARLQEILGFIKEELRRIERDGRLPAGVVLTGGGSLLAGLPELTRDFLGLPCMLGKPIMELTGRVEKIYHPSYYSALGLMLWGLQNPAEQTASINLKKMEGVVEKIRKIFKQLIP